jgi:hypothetical protein
MTKYEALNSEVIGSSVNDCWNWSGKDNGNGYGYFYFEGKQQKAHRVAWEQVNKEIPKGMCVLHKCDNRRCCNPSHLFLGTYQDNAADRQKKGRTVIPDNRGENCGTSKLSNDDVLTIRSAGGLQKDIAKMFGVSISLVSQIRSGKIWKHI